MYSVGNRAIDLEHKKIHDLINRITRLFDSKDSAALVEAFEQLESDLATYFVIEENIAGAINLDFSKHRQAHQRLLGEVRLARNECLTKNGNWSTEEQKNCADFLWNCLIRHVTEDGKPLKILLDTQYYDFKPN